MEISERVSGDLVRAVKTRITLRLHCLSREFSLEREFIEDIHGFVGVDDTFSCSLPIKIVNNFSLRITSEGEKQLNQSHT